MMMIIIIIGWKSIHLEKKNLFVSVTEHQFLWLHIYKPPFRA